MLKLDTKLKLTKEVIQSRNLCGQFSDEELKLIGTHVWESYTADKQSRAAWERRTENAMNLAMQIQKAKNMPWPDCSNIQFPLVTMAALEFHSRAYTTLIQGKEVVKCRVIGPDKDGQKLGRADRVATDMSYQVMEQDKGWEPQHDCGLLNLPIIGCNFYKSYRNPMLGHNVSELVHAKDFVIDYYAKSVETASRKTHVVPLCRNEMREKALRGSFRDVADEAWFQGLPVPTSTQQSTGADKRSGVTPPPSDQDTPFVGLEQHCILDLDQDGYAEPYIVTIEETSKCVLRIVTGFETEDAIEKTVKGEIISIRRTEYFTKYTFIPSPDGGIYDLGFGVLCGPLNEQVNALINQLTDAGTMANTAGGFLGRGAKIRGGVYTFAPLEWKRVDAPGDDLRKNIVPLEVRQPSEVLFKLLVLLIDYTSRIPGTTDTMVGVSPGQNTPAETTRSVIEQGMKIYNNIFKRVWRAMKEEFGKLYILNAMHGPGPFAKGEDYKGPPGDIVPAADPSVVSEQGRLQRAMAIKQSAMGTPGYNIEEVERNFLRALNVESIDVIYPGPGKVPPLPNPKMMVEQVKLQGKKMQFQHQAAMFAAELMETRRLNNAKIDELKAKAAELISSIGAQQASHALDVFEAAIALLDQQNQHVQKQTDTILKSLDNDRENPDGGGVPGMASPSGDQGAPPAAQQPQGAAQGAMG